MIEDIKELLKAFDNSSATKLKLKTENFSIFLSKNAPKNTPPKEEKQIIQIKEVKKEDENFEYITAPMVGTFYKAPSPDSAPYVKVGDKVKKGDVLCIIEAMKIFNEIEAEFDCEIVEVLVEDGEAVEFDTPLFKVKRL